METQMQTGSQPRAAAANQDDRVWAAIAHGSAFFVFFGPLVPVIVWFSQRKKSAYLAFQALQAMIYQSLFFWTWVLLVPLLTVLIVVVIVLAALLSRDQNNAWLFVVLPQLLMWGTILGTFVVYVGVGLWGAVAILTGRDFRYPFFGDRMARHLEYRGVETASLAEDKEDHIAGAVCHSTSAILLWGVVTPLLVWITQHERSAFLRFQALQAVIYQALGFVAYLGFMTLYIVSFLAMMGATISSRGAASSGLPAWMGISEVASFALSCVFMLGALAYPLLAFVAAVRVLNGRNFHYPILGSFLAARLKPAEVK